MYGYDSPGGTIRGQSDRNRESHSELVHRLALKECVLLGGSPNVRRRGEEQG